MSYDSSSNQLTVTGTTNDAFAISGSARVVSTPTVTGSFTIQNVDTFGDSGSLLTVDLGDY